jgi:hypothetical protein
VVTALRGWGVADAQRRAAEALDAGRVRTVLITVLDHIWDSWLAEALAVMPGGGAPDPDLDAASPTPTATASPSPRRPGQTALRAAARRRNR